MYTFLIIIMIRKIQTSFGEDHKVEL